MPVDILKLFTIRSTLSESLDEYYNTVIDKVGTTPWHRPVTGQPSETEAVHVRQVAIPVRVLKRVIKSKRDRTSSGDSRRDEEARRSQQGSEYVDPRTAQFYEEATCDEDTEEVPWSRERKNSDIKRVVVLGGPGGGKTFLTRLTAVELAQDGLAKLRDRKVAIDEMPIPIWLDLESLADAATIDDPSSESAPWPANRFRALLKDHCNMPKCLAEWISRPASANRGLEGQTSENEKLSRLAAPRCCLILDALDQVTKSKLPRLWTLLEAVETQKWKCKIVLTCRTADYVKPPWQRFTEYSLAPFGHSEIRTLVTKWFGAENPHGQTLLSAIALSYSLRHACRSPLLVTLACLVGESPPWTATTRRGLYGAGLDGLLRMLWHGQAAKPAPTLRQGLDVNVTDLAAVLPPMAWRLFSSAAESNKFPDDSVVDAIAAADRSGQMPLTATEIRDELIRRGLIFESGREDNQTQYSFVHKTFLEYLAAEHLCRVLRKDGWDEAVVSWGAKYSIRVALLVKKMTWLPSWQETLIMLTAALGEDKDQEKAVRMVSRMMELMVDGK